MLSFPQLTNKKVLLIAAGPSAVSIREHDVPSDVLVCTVNESAHLHPAAFLLYAYDLSWWLKTSFDWQNAPGRKVCGVFNERSANWHFSQLPRQQRVQPAQLAMLDAAKVEFGGLLFGEPGTIGTGPTNGNSGFQLLNLVAQNRPSSIALLGFDMGEPVHWHGPSWPWSTGGKRLDDTRMRAWRRDLDECAPILAERGLSVVNCSPVSALTAYPHVPLESWLHTG